jgi:TetR/AcrR family transcriptional repressor of nem operon
MRYDNEHKQQTRIKVLQAAAKAIRADGPHRIGVASVMAEAGLTHGGFYAHFASKDELVAAAIGQMFDESGRRFQRETEDRTPAEGLIAYVDFYLSKKHRDARGAGCPMAALASEAPRLDEAAREQFAAGARRLTRALAEKLAALDGADGKRSREAEATLETSARSIVAELVGALSLARIEPEAKRSDNILAASRQQIKQRLGLESVQ